MAKMKLSTRFFLAMLLVAFATAAIQALLTRRHLKAAIIPGKMAGVQSHATRLAVDLRAAVEGVEDDVAAVAQSPSVREYVDAMVNSNHDSNDPLVKRCRDRVEALLHGFVASKKNYVQFRLIGNADEGRELVRVNRIRGKQLQIVPDEELQIKGQRPYVVRSMDAPAGQVYLSPIELNREHGQIELPPRPVLRAAVPIHTADGSPFAVVVINIEMATALDRLRTASHDAGSVFLVDSQGCFLVHPDRTREFGAELELPHRLHTEFPELTSADLQSRHSTASPDASSEIWTSDAAGRRHFTVVCPIALSDEWDLHLIETVPESVIMGSVAAVERSGVLATLIASLCAAGLAIVATNTLTRRLMEMTKAVEAFDGHGEVSVPTDAAGEVGVLARTFKQMAHDVRESTKTLEQEVAERRRAESELQKLAQIVTSHDDAICSITFDGVITSWNRGAERLFGYRPDEIIGKRVVSLATAESRQDVESAFERVQSNEAYRHLETRLLHKNNSVREVALSISCVRDANDQPAATSMIARDIAKQKQLQIDRDRYEARFRATVEAAPTAIVMVDERGKMVLVNKATETLFKYKREQLLGNPVEMLIPDRFRPQHATLREGYFSQPMARQMGAGRDLYGRRKDGSEVPIEIGLSPVTVDDGVFVLSTIADISVRQQAERELKSLNESLEQRVGDRTQELQSAMSELTAAKESAEQANQAKSIFLANMSHEIRTPMAAVMGAAELLQATSLSERQQQYADIIGESCDALLNVINDILDFSKIEAGQLRLEKSEFDHYDIIDSCMRALGVKAQHKGLELNYRISPEIPERLTGDPTRLRQVIVNLVGNAVKFTNEGEVWLEARVDSAQEGAVVIEYSVQDTGIGIPPEKSRSIFESFEQADSSTARRFGGTGLGLAICAGLVDSMGGRIWMESDMGQGSTFFFTAKFQVPESQPRPGDEHSEGSLAGLSVMVIDAHFRTRRKIVDALESWGMAVDDAPTVEEAISRLRGSQKIRPQDYLILVDVSSFGDNGPQLLGALQAELQPSHLRILPMGLARNMDAISEAFEDVISTWLAKPVGLRELKARVIDVMADCSTGLETTHRPLLGDDLSSLTDQQETHVLLAEDNVAIRAMIVELLETNGYRVDIAINGEEAIRTWLRVNPDIILMDVQMPVVDGLAATRTIRKLETDDQRTPIVAITAHAMVSDRDRCIQSGMDGYLAKPFALQDLHDVLKAIESNIVPGGKDLPIESVALGGDESAQPRPAVVNWSTALQSADGDVALLKRLANLSIRETDDQLRFLSEAAARGDSSSLLRCTQNLKTHYQIFDAAVADHIAFHIENTVRDGFENTDLAGHVERLRKETARLQDELVEFLSGNIDPPTIS